MQATKNIQGVFDITPSEWHNLVGKKVHLGVCGNQTTDEAEFVGLIESTGDISGDLYIPPEGYDEHPFVLNHLHCVKKIRVEIRGRIEDLFWGDIVELWPLEKTCDHCKGTGKLNAGAGKPQFPALAFLEDHEEACTGCNGSGKVPILTLAGSAD